MDPITFILWMYLSWGITRMFFRGDSDAAPEEPAPAEAGPRPTPAADETAARRSLWERIRDSLDGHADDVRRERDWSNLGWWLKGLLGAAWTPIRDVRQAKKWTDDKREERRRREEEADGEGDRPETEDRSDDQPEDEEGRRWQDRRDEDEPDVEHDRDEGDEEQPRRRRRRWWHRDEPEPEPLDIEVEEVPRYGPRDPELERPIRALEPPSEPAPEVVVTVVPEPEPAPEARPALAQVIPMSRIERTPPVSTGTIATTQGGQVAAVGDLPSHSMAMTAANAIVQANAVCVDHMAATIAILTREIQVVAAKIDSLQANGITGSVLAKWADVMAQLQVARNTARQAQAQIAEAHGLSAAARTHQAVVGNPIQEAVVAAGEPNSANATRYYGDV